MPVRSYGGDTLIERFRGLAEDWHTETDMHSSIQQKVLNSNYQQIIGLGPNALPIIMEELEERPAYWFWALAAITGEDPADGTHTMPDAREKWLNWWKNRQPCSGCRTLVGVSFGPDPFASDVHGDHTPVWLCESCAYERAMDI